MVGDGVVGGAPASAIRRLVRAGLYVAVLLAVILGAAELIAAYMLFRYGAMREEAFQPKGLASLYLVEKALNLPIFRQSSSVEPAPLYMPDEVLGYVSTPGRHRVSISVEGKVMSFVMTVPRPGERATGYADRPRAHHIYVFGDSFVLGWGNNDEQTMPWLLQQRFPDYTVVNLAQNGYGITQAVLQYEKIGSALGDGDLMILPYADFYPPRDYGAPSWMRNLSRGLEQRLGRGDGMAGARYPVTRVGPDGMPKIEYRAISCAGNDTCRQSDPDRAVMIESTKAIIRFFAAQKKTVVLAFIQGATDDQVVAYARSLGLPVADVRLDRATPEWDDFGVFDGHPGPVAQFHYFEKLSQALIDRHLASPEGK